jgi:hypothetical protein
MNCVENVITCARRRFAAKRIFSSESICDEQRHTI